MRCGCTTRSRAAHGRGHAPHKQNTQEGGLRVRTPSGAIAEPTSPALSGAERSLLERRLGQIHAEFVEACRKKAGPSHLSASRSRGRMSGTAFNQQSRGLVSVGFRDGTDLPKQVIARLPTDQDGHPPACGWKPWKWPYLGTDVRYQVPLNWYRKRYEFYRLLPAMF